ncbi:MAG TPA: hypothetical protein VK152_07770 [Paludibacter sp.]|nr:hypothetical protein [Paludibacter sp.]
MTHEEFILLVKHPEKVTAGHVSGLKELVGTYPAFSPVRILLSKALQLAGSVSFEPSLGMAALYAPDRRGLFYYLYPEKKLSAGHYKRDPAGKSSGDYFDMIDLVNREGGDARQSLRNLAERLKSARALVSLQTKKVVESPSERSKATGWVESENEIPIGVHVTVGKGDQQMDVLDCKTETSESLAKKCIQEKKYTEAIAILKSLNLNNPKKSVYFADQIRFLEKVISNSKK